MSKKRYKITTVKKFPGEETFIMEWQKELFDILLKKKGRIV